MKIAFLSSITPLNIQSWSGTLYHMYTHLKEKHNIEWVGGNIYKERAQQHYLRYPNQRFIPELYVDYWTVALEDFFKYNHFDVIIARDYFFIAELDVNIPIIYIGDTTLDLMKEYLNLPTNFAEYADEIERLAIENASRVIYSSVWAADSAINHYSAPSDKIRIIEFGANLTEEVDCLPIHSERCHILFVARDWEAKGGNIVYETYKALKSRNFKFKLTIIGCNPGLKEEDIEIIEYLDKSRTEDIALLYQKYKEANFFLMPTRFDCFGIVYAEAATFGVPSLGTRVAGVSQVIREGVNGFLFEYTATGDEYACKIISIYQDTERYRNLCLTTQKDAKERLNWKVWQRKIEQVLSELNIPIESSVKISYIPTYIINRKIRAERRQHIINEFKDKPEFKIDLVEACEHSNGAVGLWNSIRKIVQKAKEQSQRFILICEDDHFFTENYTSEYLLNNIFQAEQQGALLLNGGIGGFGTALPVAPNRYWIDWFWSTQFIVIYQPLFDDILDYQFQENDTADGVLSAITPYKMALYPFVSEQKSFGYSDITAGNKNNPSQIQEFFQQAKDNLNILHRVSQYFNRKNR